MKLRKQLLTIFSGLALLALTTAGVTEWATAQWQNSEQKLKGHYQRSLLLQQVRAATFRALKEVPDANGTRVKVKRLTGKAGGKAML